MLNLNDLPASLIIIDMPYSVLSGKQTMRSHTWCCTRSKAIWYNFSDMSFTKICDFDIGFQEIEGPHCMGERKLFGSFHSDLKWFLAAVVLFDLLAYQTLK